ncbi:MAG: hypothetical protein GF372_14360, partial [Candidatus Marinimicrobia bacterium]|nr:hypothetical protein [Candidatus Neomarinimicrobiota bacterium]
AHVRRRDNLLLILQHLANVVFFFHPVIWVSRHFCSLYQEQACDNLALLANDTSPHNISRSLIRIMNQRRSPFQPMMSSGFHKMTQIMMKHRIEYLYSRDCSRKRKINTSQRVLLSLTLIFAVTFAFDPGIASDQNESSLKRENITPEALNEDNQNTSISETIKFTKASIWSDISVLEDLISDKKYHVIEQQIVSNRLLSHTSESPFTVQLKQLEKQYGALKVDKSRPKVWDRTRPDRERIIYLLRYQKKYVLADLKFTGNKSDLKLHNYTLFEITPLHLVLFNIGALRIEV